MTMIPLLSHFTSQSWSPSTLRTTARVICNSCPCKANVKWLMLEIRSWSSLPIWYQWWLGTFWQGWQADSLHIVCPGRRSRTGSRIHQHCWGIRPENESRFKSRWLKGTWNLCLHCSCDIQYVNTILLFLQCNNCNYFRKKKKTKKNKHAHHFWKPSEDKDEQLSF